MGNVYFFTGYPGFIATLLIRDLLLRDPQSQFELLVLPSQMEKAEQAIESLVSSGYGKSGQFHLILGDITKSSLAMHPEEYQLVTARVTHVYHLAAIYDLAVPEEAARLVNITGTEHVNQLVRQIEHLKRYVYFSTAYVSGKREGRVMEGELEKNQSFKNHYESTKYEAERLVQQLRKEVPVTIIRPAVVMGDSKTGETQKFDGPYFIIRTLDWFRHFPIPYLGKGDVWFNIVPVDYIVAATNYLAHADAGVNQVYHLTDPKPYTMNQVYELFSEALLGKKPSWNLPQSLVSVALSFSLIRKWIKVEKEALDYFHCLAEYDVSNAKRDLAGTGIVCPDVKESIQPIVSYYLQHRKNPDKMIAIR